MENWRFPLHFIDFETAMPAIPFNKNRCPYEGIAFQFSHHMVYSDGKVEHKGQYLNIEPGIFPNYEFIRALKEELEKDDGTIFRYANHENAYLNLIYKQLQTDEIAVDDKDELCQFIRTITEYKTGKETIRGPRSMVDMLYLVKRYYYDPAMKGSNSIKAVLLTYSIVQNFYEKNMLCLYMVQMMVYQVLTLRIGSGVQYENNRIIDPYKLLPKMFADLSEKTWLFWSTKTN